MSLWERQCVFCRITAGIEPANVVAEWSDAVAFEPLNPVTPGHLLFVPHAHVVAAHSDPQITSEVFRRAAEYADEHRDAYNLITSAGEFATQTISHLHVHYVPRRRNDGLQLPWTAQQARPMTLAAQGLASERWMAG
jgi:histidine triad (HIT) family protein